MCDPLIDIIHNVQNITSSHDSTIQNGYRHTTYGSRYAGKLHDKDVFVGRGTCVPAKIIARLGPGTLLAELRGPGTAFRCVPSYFNPWLCTQFNHKYYTVTLKSRLRVTQGHWKQNHWIDHTRLSSSRVL